MNVPIQSDYLEINQGDFAIARDNEVLVSEGLGTCIGLTIFDSKSKTGYMAHTNGADLSPAENICKSAQSDALDKNFVSAWLAGGGPGALSEDERLLTLDSRKRVLLMLDRIGILKKNVSVDWIDDTDSNSSIELDTSTGKYTHVVDSLSENLLEQGYDYTDEFFEE